MKGEDASFLHTISYISFELRNGVAMHFWYIYMIIGIYLFLPIIGKAIRFCSETEIIYFLLIWFFIQFLHYPILSNFTSKIDFTYFSGYLGYVILGNYLTKKDTARTRALRLFLIVAGFSVTVSGTYFYSKFSQTSQYPFFEYLAPNVIIFSSGLFIYIKDYNKKITNRWFVIMRDFISRNSYGIYLIHILVLLGVNKIGLSWQLITPLLGIPITTIAVVLTSGLIISLVNKMPYGRYISGAN